MARKIITAFGSSRSRPGDPEYAVALELGRRLAECGFDLCSGGYLGAMEAISRGANEAGGHVIGVTVEIFEREANPWVSEEARQETLFQRIEHMQQRADGFVVLRGGAGTLAELALTMNLLYLGGLDPRPLVLLGREWREVMHYFFSRMPSTEAERALLIYADSPAEAALILKEKLL